MFKVTNANIDARYTPEAQIFDRFALRRVVFELNANFGRSASNDPEMTLTCFKIKGGHKDTTYILETRIFVRFALRSAVVEEIDIFEFPIGYNVKIESLITLKFSKIQKEHFMATTVRSLVGKSLKL